MALMNDRMTDGAMMTSKSDDQAMTIGFSRYAGPLHNLAPEKSSGSEGGKGDDNAGVARRRIEGVDSGR